MEGKVEFMQQAITNSMDNVHRGTGGPFGAVVVKDGKIIASAWNQVLELNDPTAHAEVQAIRAACKELGTFSLAGCEVYTSAEPCPMCMAAIYWARPDRVYYANPKEQASKVGFDDAFIYEEFLKPVNERSLEMLHMPVAGAEASFIAWAEKTDRVPY